MNPLGVATYIPSYVFVQLPPPPQWFSPCPWESTSHQGTGLKCVHLAFSLHSTLFTVLAFIPPPFPFRTRQTRRGSREYHQKPNPVFCPNPKSRGDKKKRKTRPFAASACCTHTVSPFQKWLFYICALIHRKDLVKNKTIQLSSLNKVIRFWHVIRHWFRVE